MPARTFTNVSLVAEHVPESHRTLENDLTVTERELPGTVKVYMVIDGGKIPFTHLRGSDVLEAIDAAGKEQAAQKPQDTAEQPTE